ncbi:uncharacterized protein LOC116160963 isoform X2 [Photinus pyralis]|uniref:uncharacterized protein LOC116160963 isoform X2 n=1 Tax=Photinus pyralis TaxID=7054 RepID=UPI00126771D1|nr:uncharacterized protein LOC116160963 isoform X2 [Photinus pyralis]
MMETQPHLPHISDEYIYLFLHSCFYDQEKTRQTIENYFTIRANTPSLFADRNVYSDSMEFVTKLACSFKLPTKTPEGYTVVMYIPRERENCEYVFSDAIKGFCIYNDSIISEDGLVEGYVVILDIKNMKLGHLVRITLPALRAFMTYIQEAHPVRLKAIHVTNTNAFIKQFMRLIAPMIRSELIGLLRFHRGSIPEGMALEMFPKDLGGEAPTTEELSLEVVKLKEKYHEWMIETEYFVADESKRARKGTWWSLFSGSNEIVPNSDDRQIGGKDQNALRELEVD